jgi:[lysine-biosynthesis-protein LysW]--L-2-aminoadipate ligase
MATVGVLCARVRVEEKQLMAALAEAGALPTPLPPADVPLPVGRLAPTASSSSPSSYSPPSAPSVRVIVDRCQDRAVAAAILTACRALGATVLDAGLAATGDRLAVAVALVSAGLPRPETRLVCSPEAALLALAELGYPGTLLPLTAGAPAVTLLDADVAEAVLEHRAVLGSSREALALVQAGAPASAARATVVVVDGRATAVAGMGPGVSLPMEALRLAEAAAATLGAVVAGVEIALTPAGPLLWDIHPVPEYRHAQPLGERTVAVALAEAAVVRFESELVPDRGRLPGIDVEIEIGTPHWRSNGREVRDGVALSA